MHAGQLAVEAATVRGLVDAQYPQWRALELTPVASTGTVNTIFRLGAGLAVRLPLRGDDPDAVRRVLAAEAEASAELAAVSPVPTPEPVALGEPGAGYPLPWSVQTWLDGTDADTVDPAGSPAFAADLAGFVTALRAADTRGRTFTGAGRGGHLPDHEAWVRECLDRSGGLVDVASARALWADLVDLPEVDADVMSHGDLTPPNLLVRDGRLAGVLDGGGFGAADPALDLVGAWHLLDAAGRAVVRAELGCGEVQWARGRAWALQQAIGLVWYYADSNPRMAAWGRRTVDRVIRAGAPTAR